MKIASLVHIAGLFALVSLAPACAKKGASEEAQAPETSTEAQDGDQFPDKNPEKSQLHIGPRISEACGIDAADAYFDYNSARMSPTATKVLQAVATCFTSGPLAGETLRVVGHADPRGDEEYNMVLGGKRADNIAAFITKSGLSEDKIETTSRGEAEASGSDEASWKLDRKAELFVAE